FPRAAFCFPSHVSSVTNSHLRTNSIMDSHVAQPAKTVKAFYPPRERPMGISSLRRSIVLLLLFLAFGAIGLTAGNVAAGPMPSGGAPAPAANDPPDEPELRQAPQRRGQAGRPGGRGVYKAQITPHWFHHNTHFWYRNDLRGGTREFLLVDA